MVVVPAGTVLKCSRARRNLARYDATVDNVLRGGVSLRSLPPSMSNGLNEI